MRSKLITALAAGMLVSGIAPTAQALMSWPGVPSDGYWGTLINVNDAVSTYYKEAPQWFKDDKLVTDLSVGSVNYGSSTSVANANKAYTDAFNLLKSHGITVGNYISGTNVEPLSYENHFPYSVVPKQDMPSSAKYYGNYGGAPWRQMIDVRDEPTRAAFHANIKNQWLKYPAPIHYVDNAAVHEGTWLPWSYQCQNLLEINQMAQSIGSRVVFNIAMLPGELSAADMNTLVNALKGAGVSFEQPWEAVVRDSSSLTATAVKQYRQLLDAGIVVMMIPESNPAQATPAQLLAWSKTWRKSGDPLYITRAFFEAPISQDYLQ